MKNRSHRRDINRPKLRHGHKNSKYSKCLGMMMLICIKQHLETFAAQFMKKFSNTEAGLKKNVACKKDVYSNYIHRHCVYYTV